MAWPIQILALLALAVVVRCDDDVIEDRMHPNLELIGPRRGPSHEANNEFWTNNAQYTVASKIRQQLNNNRAKNVILFLGDGMSIHTITATRSFIKNENEQLSFEKFPHFGLSKTYCVDKQVPDSACTATAFLSGVKGNHGTIGVNANVKLNCCKNGRDRTMFTESIAKWAQDAGKRTGLVTTARVTHASPAGVYAHVANRKWENDNKVSKNGCDPTENLDIAQQLVYWEEGRNLNVVLGCGRSQFRDKATVDEQGNRNLRKDGKDLIEEWIDDRRARGSAEYVWNREGLLSLSSGKIDYVLGLFGPDHCSFEGDRKRQGLTAVEPSLTEMTESAIKLLQKNDKGYFLFVEGARIDMAHHETRARKALEETEEFSRAVEMARSLTSEDDTLIVVTADHSHTMTINGYSDRGGNILGLTGELGDDELPYTAISYANGPGYVNTYKTNGGGRRDLSDDDFNDPEYMYPATVPLASETHGGEDVGVFASGPHSHLFIGNYEQTNIPMLMAFISNIGPYNGSK